MALVDNLISYYSLEETSGTRVDAHGSNDLTDNNTVTSRTGKINTAASFSGSSEYLSNATGVGNAIGNNCTAMSISLWFKADTTTSNDGLLQIGALTNGFGEISFNISGPNNLNTSINGGSQTSFAFTDTSNWHHLALQYRGTTVALWLDGTERWDESVATGTDIDCSGIAFNIGAYYSSSFCFDGGIDEVAIWDRVITDAEIAELYNSGTGIGYSDINGGGGGAAFIPKVSIF